MTLSNKRYLLATEAKLSESKVAVAILVSEILKCGIVSASTGTEPKLTVVSYNISKVTIES